jgi:hypothetical protein
MKVPTAKLHCSVYGEHSLDLLIRQLKGHVTGVLGESIPTAQFLHDLWHSAVAEGYANGYVQCQIDRYEFENCEEPSASVVGDWQKRATRKASGGNARALHDGAGVHVMVSKEFGDG